jgi:3-dehydroquinate synthase
VKTLKVEAGGKAYDILFAQGALSPGGGKTAGEALRAVLSPGEKVLIVSDDNVWPLYGEAAKALFTEAGCTADAFIMAAGEKSKNMETLTSLYKKLAEVGVTRHGAVAALGGGVVGDLAGFAASTWMRGVGFIQMPTTLLAQVDSSVGGKTAIDTDEGKNLVGSFWQPRLVIIDTGTLGTLPRREVDAGMAEVVKYGAACSSGLFADLEKEFNHEPPTCLQVEPHEQNLMDVIYECCSIKAGIVGEDERDESGARAVLNFGHTFGHALEMKYGLGRYNHGEAVACGMRIAAGIGEKLGVTAKGTAARLNALLDALELPRAESTDGLIDFIRRDKKGSGGGVELILLEEIGKAVVRKTGFDELEGLLK